MQERYYEGTHFEILNVLLADYFKREGDDVLINIIGHRYVCVIDMKSQDFF